MSIPTPWMRKKQAAFFGPFQPYLVMTLRQWYAGQALMGILARPDSALRRRVDVSLLPREQALVAEHQP